MSLYDIPYLNGKKSLIAGYGLLIAGIGGVLVAFGECIQHGILQQCYADLSSSYDSLLAALAGLGIIGVGHKMEKAKDTPSA